MYSHLEYISTVSDIYLNSDLHFSKFLEDTSIVSTLRTYNSISKGKNSICKMNCLKLQLKTDFYHLVVYFLTAVDNSTLSHSSTSGYLLNISPIQNRKKWKTVYIVFIVFGACLLLLFSLFVMERSGFMNKTITRRYQQSRQEIPEPSYCEIKDV